MFRRLILKYENSKFFKKRLIAKYKKNLTPGLKSTFELIKVLKSNYNIQEISYKDVDPVFWEHSVFDNLESLQNGKTYQFCVFKVIRDSKSRKIYRLWDEIVESDYIFVIFEKLTGYITSNCNQLLLFLIIKRGIEKYDYDNNTPVMIHYLMLLNEFKKMKI